ncbi:MAG TPA: polysaccharide biosynthesis C-terminal domain-containing protein [Gaiellaceae bacterium]|nr:polysaccharide biosynthesis C-terminal domain-containing protein [Gaiellaceae bacterium]
MPGTQESEAARATTGRSVLSGGLWYVTSYAIPQGYTLVISIFAARFLGPDGMGRQSFIAFVSITLTALLSSAMYVAVMRTIGETAGRGHSELLPGLLWFAWCIEGVAALLGGALLAGAALLGATPEGAWAFAAVVTATAVLHTVPTAVLIGLQRFRQAATVGLVTGAVATPAVAIVLWQGGGITGMFATEAVIGVLNLLWTGTLARRSLREVESGAEAEPIAAEQGLLRRRVVRFAVLSSLGLFLELVVGTRIEFFFLNRYSNDAEIAFYSIAFSAVAALSLIPGALAGSTTPAFATLFGAGAFDRIHSGYSRSLRLLLIVALPLTAVAISLGPELINVVYGRDYEGAGTPVRILLVVFPVVALSSLSNALLAGLGRIRVPLIANGVAAVTDVGLALALVPSLDANGAAIANAAGGAVYALVVLVASARIAAPVTWRVGALARNAVAAAAGGLAAWGVLEWLGGVAGLLAGAAAMVAVYGVLAVLLRVLPGDDAAWLQETVPQPVVRRICRLCAGA